MAAATLGTTLYFALLLFGLGLLTATSPMIASELGRNRFSVRDVRRTFRQGLWAGVGVTLPAWIILWNAAAVLLANHGPVVSAKTFRAAVMAAEELEETAKLILLTRGMQVRQLTPEAVAELQKRFK